ncbi:MAG: DUF4058 family protein [Fimbriiglobus sp.]
MPSPFPGMDPYLEDPMYWGGFHSRLYAPISTALNRTLPEGYYAEIDEYVWLQADAPDDRRRLGKPDAFVTDRAAETGRAAPTAAVTAEPSATVTLPRSRKRTHRFLKIVGPDHATVVTVIEVLSPSNKAPGPDRDRYLAKRDEYLAARSNVVEIDLLRDGTRSPMGQPSPPAGDYYVFVSRAAQYPRADVWAFTLRDTIPPIPVPLKPAHSEVPLALQVLVTEIYDTNRYASRIEYGVPLTPALRPADAAWAADVLKKHARKRK